MVEERFARIERLFHAARALAGDARERFLAAGCGDDADLRRELDLLLEADAHDERLRGVALPTLADEIRRRIDEEPPPGDAATTPEPHPALAPESGRRIGPYTVLERIGQGGMGVVYRASQEQPIRRHVALKLIKPGMDSERVLQRFQAEQQAMALMDHPNVAKVLDAGRTEQGHPYFVMELVPGIPITEHCRRHGLGITERLELFLDVCGAVQHAHQKGIIHRDLKPSNILVTYEGGRSHAKVIDFGVAKAVNQRLAGESIHTGHGQLIGTPEYMSPEQAEMSAQEIDTRADIYSLGVVLYELLTGALPFEHRNLRRATPVEIQRILREEEPRRPSTQLRIRTDEDRGAGWPGMPRRSLMRILEGDLDWVVMKALEKDRERRYQSAGSLAEDIRRFQRDEPVTATPPSGMYLLGKFIRRHRIPVAAAAIVSLAVLAGGIGTTIGLLSARAARREAAQEASIAKAVVRFLTEDMLSAPALEQRGRDVTVLEVVEAASNDVEKAFAEHPLVEASVRRALGVTSYSIGDYEGGEKQLARAREILRSRPDAPPEEAVAVLSQYGLLCRDTGRLDEAEAFFLEAAAVAAERLGSDNPLTLGLPANLGEVYRLRGENERAITLLEPAVAAAREHLVPDDPELISLEGVLAASYVTGGRAAEGAELLRTVIEKATRVLGPDHPQVLIQVNNMASALHMTRRYAEAAEAHRRSYESRLRVFGAEHLMTITALHNLGNSLLGNGQPEEAAPFLEEALRRRTDLLPADDWKRLVSLGAVAALRTQQGRHDEAIRLARENADLRRTRYGEENGRTLAAERTLGVALREAGRLEEAEATLARTLEIEVRQDPRSVGTVLSLENLLRVVRDRGRFDEAVRRSSEGLELLAEREATPSVLVSRGDFLLIRGTSRVELGHGDEAEADLRAAYAAYTDAVHRTGQRDVAAALASLFERSGRGSEAATWRDRAEAAETGGD